MIEYTKQQLAYTDPGKDVYDTLLGLYEEGMDSTTIDKVFEELKEGLLPLTRKNPQCAPAGQQYFQRLL